MNLQELIQAWSQPAFFSREEDFILLQTPSDYLIEKGEINSGNFFMALGLTAPCFTSYPHNALTNLHQSKLFALSVLNVCIYISSELIQLENQTLIQSILPSYFDVLTTYFQQTDQETLLFLSEKSQAFIQKENLHAPSYFYQLLEKTYLEKQIPGNPQGLSMGVPFKV